VRDDRAELEVGVLGHLLPHELDHLVRRELVDLAAADDELVSRWSPAARA
jgi:hypothetical protein